MCYFKSFNNLIMVSIKKWIYMKIILTCGSIFVELSSSLSYWFIFSNTSYYFIMSVIPSKVGLKFSSITKQADKITLNIWPILFY